MQKISVVILVLLVSFGPMMAKEVTFNLDYNGLYSDNLFMNASAVGDYLSQFHATLTLPGKHINLYLDANAGLYRDNPGFNSFELEPGLEIRHIFKNRSGVFFSVAFTMLNYNELYTDFNYSGPTLQTYFKMYLTPQTIIKSGYQYSSRHYADFSSFDFQNHNAFVELNHFFRTQTTLKLQTGFNYRYYSHIELQYDFGTDYNYYQHGSHGNMGGGHHGNMGNTGNTGQMGNSDPQPRLFITGNVPNAYGILAISQGLGTRMGITLETEVRRNFHGLNDAETLIKNAYFLYPYNDDYLWDGLRYSLEMKAVIFKFVSVTGSFAYYYKDYRNVYIMDDLGNVVDPPLQRHDSLRLYRLNLSKTIGKWDIILNLSHRDNRSNDSFFYYPMTTISAGIGVHL